MAYKNKSVSAPASALVLTVSHDPDIEAHDSHSAASRSSDTNLLANSSIIVEDDGPQSCDNPATLTENIQITNSSDPLPASENKAKGDNPADAPEQSNELKCTPQLQKFGQYQLIREISCDALSTTHAARREGIDTLLAVRIFNAHARTDAQVVQIQKAAKSAAALTHPNLAVVYESGIAEDGSPYVVIDCIEGDNLLDVLRVAQRLDIARFLNVFSQICDGLIEAHSRQVIHGNLSPHKIIFANNEDQLDIIKVIDFGMPPDPVQNAFYLSPEQCLDRAQVDARVDIYSLGCLMYESLVGKPPFVGHNKSQASLNLLHELANQYSPQAPEHRALKLLDCIIIKCLHTNRAKRFGSVRELSNALKLVGDCICRGSSRKLPHKAEKLLLFRFLDFFDRKIVACAFAFLIAAQGSAKLGAELQLQKYIDAAQLAAMNGNLSLARSNWELAIQQAESANKPPSLQADLHWELADACAQECPPVVRGGFEQETFSGFITTKWTENSGFNNELSKDAIGEWYQALNYFQHGAHFQSRALALWQNIGEASLAMDDSQSREDERRRTKILAQSEFDRKQFADCASTCASYLRGNQDEKVVKLAVAANMQLAKQSPPAQALRFTERAAYYNECCGGTPSMYSPLDESITQQRMVPSDRTKLALACTDLEAGDIQAACGAISGLNVVESSLVPALSHFHNLQKETYQCLPRNAENIKHAIEAQEHVVTILESGGAKHSLALVPALDKLAQCYMLAGQNQRSMKTYQQLFALPTTESIGFDGQALLYVDLLIQQHQLGTATAFLEQRLREPSGMLNIDSGLYVLLIKCYVDAKSVRDAHEAIIALTNGTELKVEVLQPVRRLSDHYPKIVGWRSDRPVFKERTPKIDPSVDDAGF
jgi:serine/threonine protein kinase